MNATEQTKYFATYQFTAQSHETAVDTVNAIDYPQTLEEVRETCQACSVSATLKDEAGFVRGWVQADGSWSLT